MKTIAQQFGTFFLMKAASAAFIFFTASSAAAQGMSAAEVNVAIAHCGCDDKKGIELFVNSMLNDAKQRGMTCETASMHCIGCISVWCSICSGHPGAMENCIKTATAYFNASCQDTLSGNTLSMQ